MKNLILILIAIFLSACSNGLASKAYDVSSATSLSTVTSPQGPSPSPLRTPAPGPVPAPSPTPVAMPTPAPAPMPTPAPAACGTPVSGAIYITSAPFNADTTGATDSSAVIQRAIDCAHSLGVTTVVIPDGTFQISDAVGNGLTLYSGMTLTGYGSTRSKLVATAGKLVSNFIATSSQTALTINGIGFFGNSSTLNNNAAINISNDQGAANDVNGINITNNSFENFRAQCWICVTNYSQDVGTTNVTIANNTFTSQDGNAINPSIIGYASSTIWLHGSHYTPRPTAAHPNGGLLSGATIQNNTFTIPHIKNAVSLWASVSNATVSGNITNGVGVAGNIPDNVGAYALLVYNDGYFYNADGSVTVTGGLDPDNIHILSNTLSGVHSAGVYAASAGSIYVIGNTISDQYDSQDTTIPKGAIALNQPKSAVVSQNVIRNCLYGLEFVERQDYPTVVSVVDIDIFSTRANGTGIKYQSFSGDLLQLSNISISLPSGGTPMATLNGVATTGTLQFSAIFSGSSDTGPFTKLY